LSNPLTVYLQTGEAHCLTLNCRYALTFKFLITPSLIPTFSCFMPHWGAAFPDVMFHAALGCGIPGWGADIQFIPLII